MLFINNGVCPVGKELECANFDFKMPSDESDISVGDRVIFYNIKKKHFETGFVSEILGSGVYVKPDTSDDDLFFEEDVIYSHISDDVEVDDKILCPEIFPGDRRYKK